MEHGQRRHLWLLVTAGALLMVGVFADGWAHTHRLEELESFITPYHGLIFIGYLATVAVVARRLATAGVRLGDPWRLAVAGVVVFAVGFLGDGAWHTAFGIEADLEALLSPTHLLMLVGGVSILSVPLVQAWRSRLPEEPRWSQIGPAVTAATLIAASVGFFLIWLWPLATIPGPTHYLVWSIPLVALPAHLLHRFRLPPGALAVLVAVPWVALDVAFLEMGAGRRIVPVLIAAAVVDVFARLMVSGAWRARFAAAALPALVFGGDIWILRSGWTSPKLLADSGVDPTTWPPEFVAGSVALAVLAALGVVALMTADVETGRVPIGDETAEPSGSVTPR